MKKIFALLPLMGLLMLAGCKNSAPEYSGETQLYEYEDSTDYAAISLRMELPAGDDAVASAIRSTLVDLYYQDVVCTLDTMPKYDGEGTYADALTCYAQGVFAQMDTASRALAFMSGSVEKLVYNSTITKIEEAEKYVVYNGEDYAYMGGAHGNVSGIGAITFRTSDGSVVEQLITPDAVDALQPVLKEGISNYLNEKGVELSDEDFESLLLIEGDIIPLPKKAPYPTADGITFQYSDYEVLPHAYGRPTFTISYDEIDPYLTEEAKEIL